jgi:hypothetical protein
MPVTLHGGARSGRCHKPHATAAKNTARHKAPRSKVRSGCDATGVSGREKLHADGFGRIQRTIGAQCPRGGIPAARALAHRRQRLPLTVAPGLDRPSGSGLLTAPTTTLRRLLGSSVMVGPARVSRRHERPSRIAVSQRSGKSRPPRPAARLQSRVASGSASPPPGRTDQPGPAHCLCCQFGLARRVSAGRRADAATLGCPR